jgi:hypothetical protein
MEGSRLGKPANSMILLAYYAGMALVPWSGHDQDMGETEER